jgi:GPI-anchor transamidase subunit S
LPSSSTSFILPQWGGITIFNPDDQGMGEESLLTEDQLSPIFSMFRKQLLVLLGVPGLPNHVFNADPYSIISDWQLDGLRRRRTRENVASSRDTLVSILQLVKQIENMPVRQDVRNDVEGSLRALEQVRSGFVFRPIRFDISLMLITHLGVHTSR